MATTAIDIEDLERHYATAAGPVLAVNGVSLTIAAGSRVALMGPSGCGKSTLLGLIGALERPTAGRIRVFDQDLGSLGDEARAAYRRNSVGFIFQAYDLLPYLTVSENVSLQAGVSGRTGIEVGPLLERLGLGAERDKLPDQLSGGQKQRVGIARCLVHRPALVLADEPTGELDSVTSGQVVDALLETVRSIGATLVVVTHDRRVASRFERVIHLRDGRIVNEDSAGAATADGPKVAINA